MITELISLVSKFAPTLATALGSPAAGIATSLIASAFNGDAKNIPDLIKKISSDDECEGKLCRLEDDHGDIIKTLLSSRHPSKIDLHIIVNYDTESQHV